MLTDPQSLGARALVIDGNPSLRRATVAQLRELGIQQVRQCKGLADARMSLEQTDFDFVLCADFIDGSELSGQALLEELRREAVLPHGKVFVMLASEATYSQVVEAAEAALDCFVLRPYKLSALAERLGVARRRKKELGAIFEALERNQHDRAVAACLQRHEANQPYGLHCARMAAEILLKTGQIDAAMALFQKLAQERDRPWAQLGVARAHFAAGDTVNARRQVEALVRSQPHMAEAYDVLGRVQVDQGELPQALRSFHTVTEITPGCNLRLQHCGTLAYYLGDRELALEMLERAVAIGTQSRLFDALTLMLLGFLRHDMGDARRLLTVHTQLQQFLASYPASRRLQRFDRAAGALRALLARQLDEAQLIVQALADEAASEDFDLEAANLVLALWTRLPERDVAAGLQDKMVRDIGMRFCVSKVITEIMVASALHHEAITQMLRLCQVEITGVAEDAMRLAMQGAQRRAVETLLAKGETTRNARLIEMAGLLLRRHREHITDSAVLQAMAASLQQRYCRPLTHIAGIRRSGRSPGGLLLRGQRLGPAVDSGPTLLGHALPDGLPAAQAPSAPAPAPAPAAVAAVNR